jgi:hypothetical protein
MNQMSDRIVAHHEEILDALDSLSAAVIADAEGSHRFRLTGFLRHRLLSQYTMRSGTFTGWLTGFFRITA